MTAVLLDNPTEIDVVIATPDSAIEGDWIVPPGPKGAIIIANGTGANRRYDRNRDVARRLHNAGFATLLLDVLSEDEEREDALTGVFQANIKLQAERLISAARWIGSTEQGNLPIGILASGVASAAAVCAAVREPGLIRGIVSRGGRPDLAAIDLHRLITPTLLVTGSQDTRIFELNRWALRRMRGESRIAVVAGATHLFEEPGAMEEVCALAVRWFYTRMRRVPLTISRTSFNLGWSSPGARAN